MVREAKPRAALNRRSSPMSLYGALLTGVSGLDANSRALSITSSNIANVNTVGYKASSAGFSTFLAGSGSEVSSSSVLVRPNQHVNMQGLLTTTGSATDLAISGNGFFLVCENPANPSALMYTRAGTFAPDADGFLRNSAGYYLEGWTLNMDGTLPSDRALTALDLSTLNGTAQETASVDLRANLQSSAIAVGAYVPGDMLSGNVTPQFEQTVNVFDSQGGARPFELSFVKLAANTWAYEVSYQGTAADIGGVSNNPVAAGNITFNTDGTLDSPPGGIDLFTVPWDTPQTGLDPQDIEISFGTVDESDGVTQFDSPSALFSATIDGAPFGSLESVSVDELGYVTALFDNGIQRRAFKIPLATFANPNGLSAEPGNAYRASEDSGAAAILEANTGGAGVIASFALESSTADLAKEFSDLITTQRAYSAATRIITTADDMLQELMQIKR
jgi:flagellar hook protein FlgE